MRAAVHAERPEREVLRVQVVLEHEHAWEAGAVPERVRPQTAGVLRVEQVLDAAIDRRALAADGEQREHRPRRLTGDGRAAAGQRRLVVALAGLAPAAVRVLLALEPAHRALDVL